MINDLSAKRTPFSPSWWSSGGLGPFRPCDATYCLVPYESLPSIPEAVLQGTLHWLVPLDQVDPDILQLEQDKALLPSWAFSAEHWKNVMTSAQDLHLSFPDVFQRLMNAPELLERIPSCTNCYFELSEKLVPCPGKEEDMILRFFMAGQGQIAWYLYLTAQGEHCVLTGYPLLDVLSQPESPAYRSLRITEEERRMILEGRGVYVCASSFEEFLYRFWLENILWYKLVWFEGQKPLTEEEKRYLSHYQKEGHGGEATFSHESSRQKSPGIRKLPRQEA